MQVQAIPVQISIMPQMASGGGKGGGGGWPSGGGGGGWPSGGGGGGGWPSGGGSSKGGSKGGKVICIDMQLCYYYSRYTANVNILIMKSAMM